MSLLSRGKYHMEFWVLGLIFQIIIFVVNVGKTAPEICEDPFWKCLKYVLIAWIGAVVLGGKDQFGYGPDTGSNKRNVKIFGIKCYYFNVFLTVLFVFGYILMFVQECTK